MIRQEISSGDFLDFETNFLLKEEADKLLDYLKEKVSWEKKTYTDYKTGKQMPQPRWTAWYADDVSMAYSYSGVTQIVQAWLPELMELKKKLELISGAEYNSVLLNFYRDGSDSVGLHADDEKELGKKANIASVSLGATRTFQLKRNIPVVGSNKYEFDLTHGSLLVMSGGVQENWKHAIPKEYGLKEGRINLTFRKFFPQI